MGIFNTSLQGKPCSFPDSNNRSGCYLYGTLTPACYTRWVGLPRLFSGTLTMGQSTTLMETWIFGAIANQGVVSRQSPSDWKRSGKYYLEESNFLKTRLPTPIKRFSMNFLDTLDNPQQKRFSMNYLDSLNNPQKKRFSMNYMDTLKNSKQKKFSMNFLDSVDQQPRRKRFTMNFMDTLGQKGLLSKHRSSLSGHHRREENGKICFSLLLPYRGFSVTTFDCKGA